MNLSLYWNISHTSFLCRILFLKTYQVKYSQCTSNEYLLCVVLVKTCVCCVIFVEPLFVTREHGVADAVTSVPRWCQRSVWVDSRARNILIYVWGEPHDLLGLMSCWIIMIPIIIKWRWEGGGVFRYCTRPHKCQCYVFLYNQIYE